MGLVLPTWQLGFKDPTAPTAPFGYFYQVAPLAAAAAQRNITVLEHMPEDKYGKCLVQLQDKDNYDFPENELEQRIQQWKQHHGVACVQGRLVFYWRPESITMHDEFWRRFLKPSELFAGQAARMLQAATAEFGTAEFSVVHARIEADFRAACNGLHWAEWRTAGRQCLVEDADMLRALKETYSLPRGSLLFVCSGESKVAHALPLLCEFYRCFAREDDEVPISAGIQSDLTSLGFLDFCFALQGGIAFYGNMFSTFSSELANSFKANGKEAHFINPAL